METMYERIKRMSKSEMQQFLYLVYLCGNYDGKANLCDNPTNSYFGDYMLNLEAKEVLPNDNLDDLYNTWAVALKGE